MNNHRLTTMLLALTVIGAAASMLACTPSRQPAQNDGTASAQLTNESSVTQ